MQSLIPWLKLVLLTSLLLSATAPAATTPDYAREAGFSQLLEGAEGDLITLEAQQKFVGLWLEPEQEQSRDEVVIVIHGRGLHADWPNNTRPLRLGLAEGGRTTFSIQMPILEKGAGFKDYVDLMPIAAARLDAALAYLQQQNVGKVHLVAHSCGAQMALFWLQQHPIEALDSVTLISAGTRQYLKQFGSPHPIETLHLPVLDIYGTADFVARQAPQRWQWLLKAGNPSSKQVAIEDGKHMLKRHQAEMVQAIQTWLDNLPD